MRSSHSYALAGAVLFVAQTYAQKGQCYFPGGSQRAFGWDLCDPFAEQSLCCPTGWTCFSNSLCIATDPAAVNSTYPLGSAKRGACTNPGWNATVCGDFCRNEPIGNNTSGDLVACGDNNFCCGPEAALGQCNCNTGTGTFKVGSGTAVTIIGITGLANTATPTLQPSSAFATQTVSTTTATSASARSSTSSASATSPSTSTSSPTSLPSTSSTNSNLALKVGIPVGIVGGLAIIGLVIWLCCCFGKGRRKYDLSNSVPMKDSDLEHYDPVNGATERDNYALVPTGNQYTSGPQPTGLSTANATDGGTTRHNTNTPYRDTSMGTTRQSPTPVPTVQTQPWGDTPTAQRLNAASAAGRANLASDTSMSSLGVPSSLGSGTGTYGRKSPAVPRGQRPPPAAEGDRSVSPMEEVVGR